MASRIEQPSGTETGERSSVAGWEQRLRSSLEEAERFFMKEGRVFRATVELARRLDEAGIPYAIAGAVALGAYGYDVSLPMSPFCSRARGSIDSNEHISVAAMSTSFLAAKECATPKTGSRSMC